MNLGLKDKVVLITGATGEIGRQIALDFLIEDSIVVCLYRNAEKFEALKKWIECENCFSKKLYGIRCELSEQKEIIDAVNETVKQHNKIDVLVNCAGNAHEYPFAMMEERHIDDMLNHNLKNTLLITQAVLKPMFKMKSGSIVNISSVAGSKAGRGIVVYSAAKAAIDSFTRTLASEVGKKNIRVNCVRPGAVKTQMSKALEDRAAEKLTDQIVLGRIGKPAEIAKAVLFLASDITASYITGATIDVDGGLMF